MSSRLKGKVCVIAATGGSMGRASALVFAREGAKVVGCDLNVETAEATIELVHGAGGEMISMHPCHLTDPADCQSLVDLALGSFGRSDNRHAVRARLLGGAALGIEADDDVVAAVTQVLRLRVSLRPVAENCDGFAL